jgi:ribosome-binding factor A
VRRKGIRGLSKKQRETILQQVCGVIQDDDAIDPRHYFFNKRKAKDKYRKAFQLCRQVAETLCLVLADGDRLLEELRIVDVVPAPDARRLLVIVGLPVSCVESAAQVEQIMTRLKEQTPRLRAEIARSINRRKTPQLMFEITTK